jgi:tRNA pseudouridine55 synthase
MSRSARNAIDGVLLLDKPAGITSQTAVTAVRRLFNAAKAGHTGTLDPMATGLLPVCLGEATKFAHLLLEADKTYLATVRLGTTTTTGDLEGAVLETKPVAVERAGVAKVLERFVGAIRQIPPMYSAIKHAGKPLYKYARAGEDVPRAPREVTISELKLIEFVGEELRISVTCSKGTYVRVLAEDVGRELGCGGCLSALKRLAVGGFRVDRGAVTLEQLEALTDTGRSAVLLPVDTMVASLPCVQLDAVEARQLMQGRSVERAGAAAAGLARIYGPGQEFLGVVEVVGAGKMVPRRLKSQAGIA